MADGASCLNEPWKQGERWFPGLASEPATLYHPQSSLAIRTLWYSSSRHEVGKVTFPTEKVRLGEFDLDRGHCGIDAEILGARCALDLDWSHEEASGSIGVSVGELPEWGLRFWYCIQICVDDSSRNHRIYEVHNTEDFDASPRFIVEIDDRRFQVDVDDKPVDWVVHRSPSEISDAFLAHGYYFRIDTVEDPSVITLRFNALCAATTLRITELPTPKNATVTPWTPLERQGRVGLEFPAAWVRNTTERAIGWGLIWDKVHHRYLVASSRRWIDERFGGWNLWQCDGWIHVVMASRTNNIALASLVLESMELLVGTEANLAALLSGTTKWIDRTHPPYGAWAILEYLSAGGDPEIVVGLTKALMRQYFWWFAQRDGNQNGLIEYGSTPIGDGHFVHTKLAAMDEAAMDNSAVWDEVSFDATTHTMDAEDPGLNALLVVEGDILLMLSELLDIPFDQPLVREAQMRISQGVREELWDQKRQIFAVRRWDGEFASSLAPTSFYPLWAGIATSEQQRSLMDHLRNPETFGGGPLVPGTDRSHDAAHDNTYWRGRIWTPFNLLVYLGLRHVREDAMATDVAISSYILLQKALERGLIPENFSQWSYDPDGQTDCEPMYTWGGAMALFAQMELVHLDRGGTFSCGIDSESLARWRDSTDHVGPMVGEIAVEGVCLVVRVDEEQTRVLVDGVEVFFAQGPVRVSGVRVIDGELVGLEG